MTSKNIPKDKRVCPECLGIGFIECLDGDGYGSEVLCDNCNGLGYIEEKNA
jgi:hypothetical protein